jgi:hypothetical protein
MSRNQKRWIDVLLIRNIEVVIFAAAIERASGAWPMCQSPVPAESTVNFAGSFDKILSKVIYRYFPNKPLKFYRHNVFRALIFMNIFDKFFELLIGSNEIVDCLTSMQHSRSRSLFGNLCLLKKLLWIFLKHNCRVVLRLLFLFLIVTFLNPIENNRNCFWM